MSVCIFCDNGRCLLCQIRERPDIGTSSSLSARTEGDGNRRVPRMGSESHERVSASRSEHHGTWCPICNAKVHDLYIHVKKRHPGKSIDLDRKKRKGS